MPTFRGNSFSRFPSLLRFDGAHAFCLKVLQFYSDLNAGPYKFNDGLLIKKNTKFRCLLSCFIHIVNGLYFLNRSNVDYMAEKFHLAFLSGYIVFMSLSCVVTIFALEKASSEFVTLTNSLIGSSTRKLKTLVSTF